MLQIPDDLLSTAFFSFDGEPGWPRHEALKVIDLASASHIAVLGGEIWLPSTPGPRIPTPFIYTFETRQHDGEDWEQFVERTNAAAADYVRAFEWDRRDDRHLESMPYFNLTLSE